ncbi:unnamed protein product [Ambrosiozyma monospora]|uniref:Unnamed protein product n=1 Tax=Ambrosiozyma monospora TaxID=43982 RepID=A0A9W7DI34_AMBMO|nr:unnamed protein product [Ambrosiozyma monospora]
MSSFTQSLSPFTISFAITNNLTSHISVNQAGLPRLTKFYTPVDIPTQQLLLKQVHQLLINRSDSQCWFLTPPPLLQSNPNLKVIYRHYATLYFVFIVDEQESELGILDLVQVFVQVLNRCFKNVCELDLVMHWEVLEAALEEIVQGGMVIDTSISKIVMALDVANKQDESSSNLTSVNANLNNGVNSNNPIVNTVAGGFGNRFFNRWNSSI